MHSQSQMEVEIRSMRAVCFGDSKKLVLHTWPARPPTRSYQGPRLGLHLVVRLSCQRQRQRHTHTVEVPWPFHMVMPRTTEYLALALPSATVAAAASSLDSDSFMNNAFGRMVRRGICPDRRA